MAPKNLRSVVGQANRAVRSNSMRSHRSFRSSHDSNNESVKSWFLTRCVGLALGCGIGNLYFGDDAWKLEDDRHKRIKLFGGGQNEIQDLRKNLWFYKKEKELCDLKDKLLSGLKETAFGNCFWYIV